MNDCVRVGAGVSVKVAVRVMSSVPVSVPVISGLIDGLGDSDLVGERDFRVKLSLNEWVKLSLGVQLCDLGICEGDALLLCERLG